jgi:hypothetical protein
MSRLPRPNGCFRPRFAASVAPSAVPRKWSNTTRCGPRSTSRRSNGPTRESSASRDKNMPPNVLLTLRVRSIRLRNAARIMSRLGRTHRSLGHRPRKAKPHQIFGQRPYSSFMAFMAERRLPSSNRLAVDLVNRAFGQRTWMTSVLGRCPRTTVTSGRWPELPEIILATFGRFDRRFAAPQGHSIIGSCLRPSRRSTVCRFPGPFMVLRFQS